MDGVDVGLTKDFTVGNSDASTDGPIQNFCLTITTCLGAVDY